MADQKQLWNNSHQNGELDHYSTNPTDFAREVGKVIKPHSKILELGCGVGNDSIYFATSGHQIIATDFSDIAIEKNKKRFGSNSNLAFQILDMNQTFSFGDKEFDVVYARLSLHYFTDDRTGKIIGEIYRVLKPNGYLCFICKSVNDSAYGKGREIEKDMFEIEGHARHFFSEEYALSLLEKKFKIEKMESGNDKFYGGDSSFVKVIAQAVK